MLNLPNVVTLPSGGTSTFVYDATGKKLRKVNTVSGTTTTTDYINGIQYNNSYTAIGYIQTEEGQAVPNGTGYDYQYFLGDNLGNTRVTFGTKTGTAAIIQKDDYYPFGLEINRTPGSPKNEYLYNRKELQEETGLYDYGARFYDPIVARWTTIDPLTEISRRWTPYNYVESDPIRMTDPDGMSCDCGSAVQQDNQINNSNWLSSLGYHYIGANAGGGGTKGPGPGPKMVSGPNGIGPKDKITVPVYNGLPYVALDKVTIHADFGPSGLEYNPAMKDNPYMPTVKEDNESAMTELGIVGGELGGELLGPLVREVGALFKSAEYTKSSLSIGRAVHDTYKLSDVAPELGRFKEFREIPGIRPDFVDFGTKTIYKLKPFNPRAINLGLKQLNKYQSIF